jgi:hypothetical protein
MAETIKLRRDAAGNWTAANPILALGEPGYETNTGKLKIGDGATHWNSLAYFVTGGGDVLGPGSAVNSDFAQFDGTTGKLIKDGGLSLDTSTSLGTSDSKIPSQKAVKTYVDAGGSGDVHGPGSSTGGDFAQYADGTGKLLTDGGMSLDIDGTLAADSDSKIPSQKAVKTYVDGQIIGAGSGDVVGPGAAVDLDFAQFDGATGKLVKDGGLSLDTDGTLAADSNLRIPSQQAVKAYADVGFVPKIGGALDDILTLAVGGGIQDSGKAFDTDGTLAANSDNKIATQKAVKTYSDAGDTPRVVGPGSAVDSDFAQFDSTTGKLIKDGGLSLDTNGGLAANSDSKIPSQKAVKTYVDGQIIGAGSGDVVGPGAAVDLDLVQFDGTTGKLVKDGGLSLDTDGTLAADSDSKIPSQKAVKTYIDASPAGDVVGPGSAVDSDFAQFDSTTGKLIKDGGLSLDIDGGLAANSDSKVPSQKAVKTYVDGQVFAGSTPIPNTNVARVDPNGNDGTGIVGDFSKPFQTVTAAIAALEALSPSDIVYIDVGLNFFAEDITTSLITLGAIGRGWLNSSFCNSITFSDTTGPIFFNVSNTNCTSVNANSANGLAIGLDTSYVGDVTNLGAGYILLVTYGNTGQGQCNNVTNSGGTIDINGLSLCGVVNANGGSITITNCMPGQPYYPTGAGFLEINSAGSDCTISFSLIKITAATNLTLYDTRIFGVNGATGTINSTDVFLS